MTKYATYVPSAGDRTSLFGAYTTNSDQAKLTLYKKVTNTVIIDDETTHTVLFLDHDGTVLSTQTVADGAAAIAPPDPVREGWTFIGWDKDFSCVTSDMVVTALYVQDVPSQYMKGDVNCDGIVDSADVTLAAAFAMNAGLVTAQGVINGDMNGDGLLNAADLSALYNYILS